MKKLLLSAVAFATMALAAQAQTQKGYYIIGGSIANISGNTTEKSFKLALSPKAAWFIQDNFALGGEVRFGIDAGRGRGPSFNYFVGPMARYYFGEDQVSLVKQTRFFGEANAGIGGTNGGGNSTNGFEGGIGPGLAYFVTENVALELLAKANFITGAGNKSAAFAPSLALGFQIHLPGSKIKQVRDDMK